MKVRPLRVLSATMLVLTAWAALAALAPAASAAAQPPAPAAAAPSGPGAVDSSEVITGGPLVVPRAVEDSVMDLVSRGQVQLIRESDPRGEGEPRDHPLAWQCFLDALVCLARSVGDHILDDSRGPQYLGDHGLRTNLQRPRLRGFPVLLTFYNDTRVEETASFLIDRRDGRYLTQRIEYPTACCWAGQSIRAWSEGGRDYAVLHLQGVGRTISRYRLQFMRREGDGWKLYGSRGVETFGERATVALAVPGPGVPTLNVVQLEASKLFEAAPSAQTVQLRSDYELHADTLLLIKQGLDPSFFGPPVWVMESLARGHRDWALPYVSRPSMLDSLAALPWPQAKEGWKLESYSARFDTILVSHPAAGRLRLFGGKDGRRWMMTGYRVEPLADAKPARRAPRKGGH